MTRRDFEFFAALMRRTRGAYKRQRDWKEACSGMAEHCARTNAQFDRIRFLTACGITVPRVTVELAAIIDKATYGGRAPITCVSCMARGAPWCGKHACTLPDRKARDWYMARHHAIYGRAIVGRDS